MTTFLALTFFKWWMLYYEPSYPLSVVRANEAFSSSSLSFFRVDFAIWKTHYEAAIFIRTTTSAPYRSFSFFSTILKMAIDEDEWVVSITGFAQYFCNKLSLAVVDAVPVWRPCRLSESSLMKYESDWALSYYDEYFQTVAHSFALPMVHIEFAQRQISKISMVNTSNTNRYPLLKLCPLLTS